MVGLEVIRIDETNHTPMTAAPPDFDSTHFRRTLGRFPTGVTIITAWRSDGDPVGLTVSSFNAVSLSPPLVLWSLSVNSSSLNALQACDRYAIQVLAADQLSLAGRFATGSQAQRFEGIPLTRTPRGAPRLDLPVAAWFECHNRRRHEEGDHLIFIGQVEHCEFSDTLPLVYHAGGYDLTPSPKMKP